MPDLERCPKCGGVLLTCKLIYPERRTIKYCFWCRPQPGKRKRGLTVNPKRGITLAGGKYFN